MHRWIGLAVMGMMASVANADLNLQYSATELQLGVPNEVELSLVGNSDVDTTIGAIIIDFGPGSDLGALNPTAFEFDETWTESLWTHEVTLPNTVQTVFGGSQGMGPALVGTQTLSIGTLTLEPTSMGEFTLDANLNVTNSDDFDDLLIKSGDPRTFNVVPEPASIALLAMGAVSLVRRRTRAR